MTKDSINSSKNKQYLFRFNAERMAKLIYESEIDSISTFLDGCKKAGLVMLNWSFYKESEYTEGMSAKVEVYNPTKKTIKYIWLTFIGYNPVGDKVIDTRKGTSNITVNAVGPINPNENGAYEFKYVWFTDLVKTAKISLIKVQYMDGSFKTIINPKSISLKEEYYNFLKEQEE
jgi:hypothetical protein